MTLADTRCRPGIATMLLAVLAAALAASSAQARVTRIVIDNSSGPVTIDGRAYQTLRGRAFGELDPAAAHNAVITDIARGRDADGRVRYETTFTLTQPVDAAQASGLLWHDVPNRGWPINPGAVGLGDGDALLASGWQADNAGSTAVPADRAGGNRHWVAVPVAKNADGSLITGRVLARIVNRSGPDSAPLNVLGNPVPYLPATLDTRQAVLTAVSRETSDGQVTVDGVVPAADWAYARCDAATPFPGTPQNIASTALPGSLPVHICLKNGFDARLLYQLVYPAKGAYLLGVGMAAFRDVGAFFKFARQDDFGNANPLAGRVTASAMRGSSQSGNFIRQFIYMGLNQDEAGRKLHDGAWPQIAGRRVAANVRWGQPDGVLELYQLGSEGAQWWTPHDDALRGNPASSILARCTLSNTCPKVIEHFGSAEVYALKMTMEWVGAKADTDIALPPDVRRYYIPSTSHGGGSGGFVHQAPATGLNCPGNNWGAATLRANPMPATQMVNVIRAAMRAWLLNGTPPPPSRYPTLREGTLVSPSRAALGFPQGVPGVPSSIFLPENFIFPVFDYDWGPHFNAADATGVPTKLPPPIKRVIAMKVPRVNADGNELGGVPTVLNEAPLGTYLGWNITAAGFHAGKICNYVGGYIPFATTRAERLASGDPRLSLEERYGSHEGYVAAVRAAAASAYQQGYLLQADRDALLAAAAASAVLSDVKADVKAEVKAGTEPAAPAR